MNARTIQTVILFLALLLAQVLICNHILLFGVAVPFVFIYFIIRMPIDMNVSLLLTLSFLMGLGVDIFSDTAGMNALACTITAMSRRRIFFSYVLKDDKSATITPSIGTIGAGSYLRFLATTVALYCLLIFSIEYFSISNVEEILIKTVASAALTTVLLLAVDSLTSARREKRL